MYMQTRGSRKQNVAESRQLLHGDVQQPIAVCFC